MSFGFGIGDFITVATIANDLRKDFIAAPSEYGAIRDETTLFYSMIEDVRKLVLEDHVTPHQKAVLADAERDCKHVLDELKEYLNKNSELDSTAGSQAGLRGRSRRLFKRLRASSVETSALLQRLANTRSMLTGLYSPWVLELAAETNALSSDTNHIVQNMSQQLEKIQLSEEDQKMLDWLVSLPDLSRSTGERDRRQVGTGTWFLRAAKYARWRDGASPTLICPGHPGAGKTVMSTFVLDDLWHRYSARSDIRILNIYCSFRLTSEQTLTKLLCSLVRQAVERLPAVPADLKKLYEEHNTKQTRPHPDQLVTALLKVIEPTTRTYVVIDALDECRDDDRTLYKLIEALFRIQSQLNNKVSLLATTRVIQSILDLFKNVQRLEICADDVDVGIFLDSQMPRLPRLIAGNVAFCNEIRDSIVECVDGIFLLARMHFDLLSSKTTLKAMKAYLSNLRKDGDALSKAYEQQLTRIDAQVEEHRLLAKRVLSWVTHANGPFTVRMLQQALAVVPDMTVVDDEDDVVDPELMISVCAGLVVVDDVSQVVRLIHYTTQEFMEGLGTKWLTLDEVDIGKACLEYLRLRGNAWPFLSYAVENWIWHLSASHDYADTADFIVDCLHSSSVWRFPEGDGKHTPPTGNALHVLAAFEGYDIATKYMDKFGCDAIRTLINEPDNNGRTPLMIAVRERATKVVSFLLEHDNLDVSIVDSEGRTALHFIAIFGGGWILQAGLLLHHGLDFDRQDHDLKTALHLAIEHKHVDVAQLLLPHCDTERVDGAGNTALMLAVRARSSLIKVLLHDPRTNVSAKDNTGMTALHVMAELEGLLPDRDSHLLLQHSTTNVNAKDDAGLTPLHLAAGEGHSILAALLLSCQNVDVDVLDNMGRSPLHIAAYRGHLEIVKLLLPFARADGGNHEGFTALHVAALQPVTEIVELLLSRKEVQVDVANIRGWTPLHCAADCGYQETVRLLLPRSDVNRITTEGYTALSLAMDEKWQEIVDLLLGAIRSRR